MKTIPEDFNREKIEYRLLIEGTCNFILIKDQMADIAFEYLRTQGYREEEYRFSRQNGYIYRYGMEEPKLFCDGEEYAITCAIPCHSLTPFNVIPLERSIQEYAWKNPKVIDGRIYTNDITTYIFRVTECVFRKKRFEQEDCLFFEDNNEVLNSHILPELLHVVFYSYTDQLLCYLQKGEYQVIFKNYLMWKDY